MPAVRLTDWLKQAFLDGLAYGSNVENANPELAWSQSRLNPSSTKEGGE